MTKTTVSKAEKIRLLAQEHIKVSAIIKALKDEGHHAYWSEVTTALNKKTDTEKKNSRKLSISVGEAVESAAVNKATVKTPKVKSLQDATRADIEISEKKKIVSVKTPKEAVPVVEKTEKGEKIKFDVKVAGTNSFAIVKAFKVAALEQGFSEEEAKAMIPKGWNIKPVGFLIEGLEKVCE